MAATPEPLIVSADEARLLRTLADHAFSRAAGAPLIPGNRVRLLRDARENYGPWQEAIRSARHTIYFESYIIHSDDVGRQFAALLASKAREGVRVRIIYDWFGALTNTWWTFWTQLRRSGAEVRCFNPPRLDSAFGWLSRDHRKCIIVDGRIAFVTGLCVGRRWAGYPDRGIAPWRDTGVEIEGPAVVDVERAFAETWAQCGPPLPDGERSSGPAAPVDEGVDLRIIPSRPGISAVYRLDQLIAALARESIWLTDAYFVGTSAYIQALCSAAADGVDVRLLLPRTGDVPIVRAVSRAGYHTLIEAGVRVFEWNGPMLHAKTAVADGRWARVGSTNLNLASWLGNWELDVVIEDEGFANQMQMMYLDDLSRSTEIVLTQKRHPRPVVPRHLRSRPRGAARGSANWAAKGVLRIGNAVGAAIINRRVLGPAEVSLMLWSSLVLLGIIAVAVFYPKVIAITTAVVCAWITVTLLAQSLRLRYPKKPGRPNKGPSPPTLPKGS